MLANSEQNMLYTKIYVVPSFMHQKNIYAIKLESVNFGM